MRIRLAVMTLATALVCVRANAVSAVPVPSASVTIDGEVFPIEVVPTGKEFIIGGGEVALTFVNTAGDTVSVFGTGNTDPALSYGLHVVDVGAPSTFAFTFAIPIVPTGPNAIIDASISGQLTDVDGNGVTLTALAPPLGVPVDGDGITEVQVGTDPLIPVNLGGDVGPTAAFGPGAPGSVHTYGSYDAIMLVGPPNVLTGLQVDANFGLTGGGDTAMLTGFVSALNPDVPEPGALATLVGCSSAGAAIFWRRRRR